MTLTPGEQKKVVVIASSVLGVAHARLAAEALRAVVSQRGHSARVEARHGGEILEPLTGEEIRSADVVLLGTDGGPPASDSRVEGKRVVSFQLGEAVRNTGALLDRALGAGRPPSAPERPASRRLVAVTSCPTGIAHTFMAAEALKKASAALGHTLRAETQGSVGAQDTLTAGEIASADVVILAADTQVDEGRFAGKPLYRASTQRAIADAAGLVRAALESAAQPATAAAGGRRPRSGTYRHLMTGVSHMLPVVVAGGLSIALAFAAAGIYAGRNPGTLGWALSQIGAAAFGLMVPVLAGYIAFSIGDRPALAPGLIGGMLAQQSGAGFLGGIVAGFLAGGATRLFNRSIRLPRRIEGLKPVLILPLFGSLAVGLLMIYVIAPPTHGLLAAATGWLARIQGVNAALLGTILGAMMAFDMGGPVNKAAYTFAVGLLASRVTTPMAAVMAAGMTPPLGAGLAAFLFPRRFDADEREIGGATLALGLSFITEGAIPYAAKDPLRVIPAFMAGSAVAGALSMASGIQLQVPHGGIFAILIPGAVTHLALYLGAIAAGTVVTILALFGLKRGRPPGFPTP